MHTQYSIVDTFIVGLGLHMRKYGVSPDFSLKLLKRKKIISQEDENGDKFDK